MAEVNTMSAEQPALTQIVRQEEQTTRATRQAAKSSLADAAARPAQEEAAPKLAVGRAKSGKFQFDDVEMEERGPKVDQNPLSTTNVQQKKQERSQGKKIKLSISKRKFAALLSILLIVGLVLTGVAMGGHLGQNFLSDTKALGAAFLAPGAIALSTSLAYLYQTRPVYLDTSHYYDVNKVRFES